MNDYDDIIDMPYRPPKVRRPMNMHQRAAQFAPFAALSGFEEAIELVAEHDRSDTRDSDG